MKNRVKKYTTTAALAFAVAATLTGCGGGGTAASTADTTAPTTMAAPSVTGTTDSAITLSVTVNENGTGYYLVKPTSAAAATQAEVLAGTSFALTANVPATPAISGLTFNTYYTVYFVAKDAANNVQAAVQSVPVTTLLTAGYVVQGGLTWTPSNIGSAVFGGDFMSYGIPGGYTDWNTANTYCTTATINGLTGWRLPTQPELSALYTSGAMNGQGWTFGSAWSSTQYSAGYHYFVGLNSGYVNWASDTGNSYVSCVR